MIYLVLIVVVTLILEILYHRFFHVVYVSLYHGLMKELFVCFLIAMVIVGLITYPFRLLSDKLGDSQADQQQTVSDTYTANDEYNFTSADERVFGSWVMWDEEKFHYGTELNRIRVGEVHIYPSSDGDSVTMWIASTMYSGVEYYETTLKRTNDQEEEDEYRYFIAQTDDGVNFTLLYSPDNLLVTCDLDCDINPFQGNYRRYDREADHKLFYQTVVDEHEGVETGNKSDVNPHPSPAESTDIQFYINESILGTWTMEAATDQYTEIHIDKQTDGEVVVRALTYAYTDQGVEGVDILAVLDRWSNDDNHFSVSDPNTGITLNIEYDPESMRLIVKDDAVLKGFLTNQFMGIYSKYEESGDGNSALDPQNVPDSPKVTNSPDTSNDLGLKTVLGDYKLLSWDSSIDHNTVWIWSSISITASDDVGMLDLHAELHGSLDDISVDREFDGELWDLDSYYLCQNIDNGAEMMVQYIPESDQITIIEYSGDDGEGVGGSDIFFGNVYGKIN